MTKKRTAEQWQQLVQAQQESDLTVSQFCTEYKLAGKHKKDKCG